MATSVFASLTDHHKKVTTLQQQYQTYYQKKQSVSLQKDTSNLFRHRRQSHNKLNVRAFNQVLAVDIQKGIVIVEGMTTYENLLKATLQYDTMPAVVPELKTITIGGALAGIGIESSSFRYGLVHETITEFDVLLGDGRIVTCRADNEHRDLFFAFPNSYGTLGYALRIVAKIVPVKPYVKLNHQHFSSAENYFQTMKNLCKENRFDGKIAFIEGSVFNENEMVITTGEFVDHVPYLSNYQYMKIYYQSIRKQNEDYLTTENYIWRWDTDWFWCSKVFYLQNPALRFFFGKWLLKSKIYWQLKNLINKNYILRWLEKKFSQPKESVIQDVAIPVENAVSFFDFFQQAIKIKPFWNCPVMAYKNTTYSLFPVKLEQLYINFGFWDRVPTDKEAGHYNRLIEKKVSDLQGIKSLYSTAYYTAEEFWQLYDKKNYEALKKKYDPAGLLRDLYAKCSEKAE